MKTPKLPLQAGDRVRVFHRNVITGKVDTISPDGHIGVIEDGFYSQHDESPFHPRQCVRLKKKEAPKQQDRVERIRARVEFDEQDRALVRCTVFDRKGSQLFPSETTVYGNSLSGACLSEIHPGELIISRKELIEAFAQAYCTPINKNKELDSHIGMAIVNKLFPEEA